jgi:tetratricopeptide (TPR) repeat protein
MTDRATAGGFLGASLGSVVGAVTGLIGGGVLCSSWFAGEILGGVGYLLWVVGALIGGLIAAPFGMIMGAYTGTYIGSMLAKQEAEPKEREFKVLLERALTELQERNWDQAVISLTEVIRWKPGLIEAYHRRAIAYLALNQLDCAIADCNRVIKTDPTPITRSQPVPPHVAEAYVHRGIAFAQMGQHDKAIADFTEAIQLTPDVPTPYQWRAQSYRAMGNATRAAEDERKAHDLPKAVS